MNFHSSSSASTATSPFAPGTLPGACPPSISMREPSGRIATT
ncbi:hypothetical protein OHA74_11865 [Streptomyces phaeochromogenes]|nr:hypothetical protein [Streptomyces phaeochromogenes]